MKKELLSRFREYGIPAASVDGIVWAFYTARGYDDTVPGFRRSLLTARPRADREAELVPLSILGRLPAFVLQTILMWPSIAKAWGRLRGAYGEGAGAAAAVLFRRRRWRKLLRELLQMYLAGAVGTLNAHLAADQLEKVRQGTGYPLPDRAGCRTPLQFEDADKTQAE